MYLYDKGMQMKGNRDMNDMIKKCFIHPENEFSPMPFWFWNDAFDYKEIKRQINDMHDKGVCGFVIHPRIGIPEDIPYMSDAFLSYVLCAVQEAQQLNMQVILYDEGMYPSGSAHGMVVERNAEYASKGIRVAESAQAGAALEPGERLICTLTAEKKGDMALDPVSICCGAEGGRTENSVYLHFIQGFTGGHIRGIHIGEDDGENPPKSADLLNPKAVDTFIELTHQRYYDVLAEYFGNTVIAIFTDEPSIMGREGDPRMKPWSDGFMQDFLAGGCRVEDLAALWYDIGEKTETIRKKYAKAVEKRLTETFYKRIHDWCEAHEINLAGHPGASDDIGLLKYFHIPGQDLIFRRVAPEEGKALWGVESTQAKCSADAARHSGKRRNLNECFACSGKNGVEWSFTADDMKWMTDWLLVRGVNMLVPHAFFYSVRGERRFGERPPDVGPNNIWWDYYPWFSAYIKRMSYMMTDSYNTAEVAVLCESDSLPYAIVKPLYENQIEFNYLEEELLNSGAAYVKDGALCIRQQRYKTLLCEKRRLVDDKIQALSEQGIQVIVYNPENAEMSGKIISINAWEEVTRYLTGDIKLEPANRNLRVSHIVKENEHFYVLVNEGEEEISGTVTLQAEDEVLVMDAWHGTIEPYVGQRLALERRESLIIAAGRHPHSLQKIHLGENEKSKTEISLAHWKVNGESISVGSWTENPDMRNFCGTIAYETEFEWKKTDFQEIILDLGSVGEQAEIEINGKKAGFRLWAPYEVELTPWVRQGKNTVSVFVTNSLSNRYTEHRIASGILKCPVLRVK